MCFARDKRPKMVPKEKTLLHKILCWLGGESGYHHFVKHVFPIAEHICHIFPCFISFCLVCLMDFAPLKRTTLEASEIMLPARVNVRIVGLQS